MGTSPLNYDCGTWWGFLICLALDWQTLLAGAVAIIAATWTVKYMRRQIAAESRRHKEIRASKAFAARARLPDALSDLSGYLHETTKYLRAEATHALPVTPDNAMEQIKSGIEFVDPQSSERLYEVAVRYQTHRVRIGDYSQQSTANRADRLYDTTCLQALANSLFKFARNEEDIAPNAALRRRDMMEALNNVLGPGEYQRSEAEFVDVVARIDRRHGE